MEKKSVPVWKITTYFFSGLPGAPQDCHVGREGNESLGVVCVAGWSGGLDQTFHLGQSGGLARHDGPQMQI